MELLTEHLGNGLLLVLLLSLPCVLTAAGIGLIVGILQAVTQVQEQTIAAAPKIVGVFLVILLGGGLMMTLLTNYVRESVQIAFNEIPQDGIFVLPPKAHQADAHVRARQFFQEQAKGEMTPDRVKDFAANWQMPAGDSASTVVLTGTKNTSGNALGPAEKLMLEQQKPAPR